MRLWKILMEWKRWGDGGLGTCLVFWEWKWERGGNGGSGGREEEEAERREGERYAGEIVTGNCNGE